MREEIQHQRETVPPTSANGVGPESGTQTGPAHRPIRANHGDLQCPVCLADAQFAIQTNCSHIFCGKIHNVNTPMQHAKNFATFLAIEMAIFR